MKLRGVYIFPAACLLSLSACSPQPSIVSDGFEGPTLSALWSTRKFVPGAVEIQSAVVRQGKGAARITLHHGDQMGKERGTILERAELMEARELWAREDSSYSYSFSLFLPRDFPVLPNRLILAQWKQDCPDANCDPASPVIALRYEAGLLCMTVQAAPAKDTVYRLGDEIRNRWLDFRVRIRFSRSADGWFNASLNGRQIVEYRGPTAYPPHYGYKDPGRFYFKMGLYRNQLPETMTIYVDEYRKEPA